MWAFMDKVVFDKTGNTVTLLKKFEKPTDADQQFANLYWFRRYEKDSSKFHYRRATGEDIWT